MPNSLAFPLGFLGVAWAGAATAPLNPDYKQEEFAFYLEVCFGLCVCVFMCVCRRSCWSVMVCLWSDLEFHTHTQNKQDNAVDILLVSAEGNPNAEAAAKVHSYI